MENGNKIDSNNPHKNKVHWILAHSYTMYFVLFLASVFLDFIFPTKIFKSSVFAPTGIIFLIFGSFLVIWAQKTSRDFKKENMSKETFCKGPYCYTRSPTHWGLFFLVLGFGIVANAVFIVLFTLVAFLI